MNQQLLKHLIPLLVLSVSACGSTSGDDDANANDQDLDGYTSDVDCDDQNAAINPGEYEVCDSLDNNCNFQTDEGFQVLSYYIDSDGDGYGSAGSTITACQTPAGYVTNSQDCDDSNRGINPGTIEVSCNGVDENCTGADDDSPNVDSDGYDACAVGVAGADALEADCNDSNPSAYPGASELCNDADDNCNGSLDEGLELFTFYQDADNDRYGTAAATTQDCSVPYGYSDNDDDCDDTNSMIFPGAFETFADGIDSNCNGMQDYIFTISGNGVPGYGGDNGNIANAQLYSPSSIIMDLQDNLLLADSGNHRVRKFQVNGTIQTLAGNGTADYTGDGGYSTAATLNNPMAVTIDVSGVIYIADTDNHVIRKIAQNGIITTFAGNGTPGFSGDGFAATSAQLNSPMGVTVDATGAVYIADTGNHRIRVVTAGQTKTINTYAGTGSPGYSGDDGPANLATLSSPMGLSIDVTNNLAIADSGNHAVRMILITNKEIMTVAGNGEAGYEGDYGQAQYAQLNTPTAVFVGIEAETYIADTGNNVIRLITPTTTIYTVAGNGEPGYSGDSGPSTNASLNAPRGIATDTEGMLAIPDTGNHVIRRVIW